MKNIQYHQETLDILKLNGNFSEIAISNLDKREQELGIKFPSAVREWFSIVGTYNIFKYYSNDDYLFEISEIGKKSLRNKNNNEFYTEPEKYYDQKMLAFLLENQGVFEMSFLLDGSEDPSVWIWDDDQIWRQIDQRFSHFIYSWIWNSLYYRSPYRIIAKGNEPSPKDLSILRSHLKEVFLESNHLYCFEGVNQHLTINLSYKNKVVWWLETASSEALYSLAKVVVQCNTFATTKYSTFRSYEVSSKSEDILELLKKESF